MALDPNNWVLATGKTQVVYTPGPAKVAIATPAPGASLAASPASITLVFSENINAQAGAFTLTGPGGTVPFSFAYAAASQTATLTPSQAMASGLYTLGWNSALITSVSGGATLDGETTGTLPSGDGQAGGNGSITFSIAPACDPDLNQDGNADQGDVDYLIDVVAGGTNTTSIDPDFNQDGNVDQGDVDALVNVIAGGACP
jgi:methionine-rich copper-binding protein CopC